MAIHPEILYRNSHRNVSQVSMDFKVVGPFGKRSTARPAEDPYKGRKTDVVTRQAVS